MKWPLKTVKTKIFMTNGSLMKVESIAECSKSPWSILQYFWPALSNNLSWKPTFSLFESGLFIQVLLYLQKSFTIVRAELKLFAHCHFWVELVWFILDENILIIYLQNFLIQHPWILHIKTQYQQPFHFKLIFLPKHIQQPRYKLPLTLQNDISYSNA